ncbi:MAG: tRNA pseudouridine(38-40) synthase TruA [Muribaculaceae bacterium]|nr:tRNA pseudouridine(38-40) synthase TruA [Muribaculaceae bacterium]
MLETGPVVGAVANKRYFMTLAYNGAPFHGWQSQPNAISVQSTLESAMSLILRREMKITGAGRTDAGVNARKMVAHFDLPVEVPSELVANLHQAINAIVGPDIVVYDICEVHKDAHARFDAVQRTYHYYTHSRRSPFLNKFSWLEPTNLDFDKMNEAAEILLQTSDFTSFSKLHTDVKTNLCNLTYARWENTSIEGSQSHVFVISADRFLRNMVRAVVGTLVDVGRGKLSLDGFVEVIAAKNRCVAGASMPPHPLFLWDIQYPFEYQSRCDIL